MKNYDVVIIGGGAAGLACAVSLKREDRELSVAVVERGERLGRKLAATGNGQGNVSNADLGAEHFHGSLAPLAAKLIGGGAYDPLSLFDCLFVTDKSGRIYPSGKQASALSDSLIAELGRQGTQTLTDAKVVALTKGLTLTLADGEKLSAKAVVAAFGGKAQKQFGTDGESFGLVRSLGHGVTPLTPAIVQLKCDTRYIKPLKGIRAECRVSAFAADGRLLCRTSGDVIFTDYGVSGNAAFYVSSYLAGEDGAYLSLEFLPSFTKEQIAENVRYKQSLGYAPTELLSGTLHNQIGRAVLRRCESSDPETIAQTVKNFTLPVYGSLGFDYAQTTRGGIPAAEIDGDLQSRLVRGLFFAGEALDLDGDCGGYNLTWALVSGMHAAKSVVRYLDDGD